MRPALPSQSLHPLWHDMTDGLGRVLPAAFRQWSGFRISKLSEEDLIQLVVIVLTCVNENMVNLPVQFSDDSAEL